MKEFGLLSFAAGFVAVGVWLLQWSSAAIPEAISVLSAGGWSSALGLWMLKAGDGAALD